jgi:hypothetical protein
MSESDVAFLDTRLTAVRGGDRERSIEWRTYTPDGRVLTVRRADGIWTAVCGDGDEYDSESLHDAIRDAVGHERGEALTLQLSAHDAVTAWVAEQAARIESEYERG